jgi:hypothetical protein
MNLSNVSLRILFYHKEGIVFIGNWPYTNNHEYVSKKKKL